MRSIRSFLRKRRGQRGAAAVEFALVATPFLFLMFSLFEIMMVFFVQTSLESAIAEESRKIKTGQANSGTGINAATFKANVCARMMGMVNCADRLFIFVYNPPSAGPQPSPMADPTLLATPVYTPNTAAGSLVIVRGVYMWQLITPGISTALSNTNSSGPSGNLGTNNRMMIATSVFRNEPFQ